MKILILLVTLLVTTSTHPQIELTAKIQPKNDGFQGLVDADQIDVDASGFSGNLSASDDELQTALATIDALVLGGGSGSVTTVKEGGVQIGDADIVTLDFSADDFTVTESPDTEINIIVNDAGIDHDSLLNFVGNEHIDHTSVTLTAGEGLTGTGDISASRSFALDFSDLSTTETVPIATDLFSLHDGAQKKVAFSDIEGALDHDALTNFVTNEHLDWSADQGATNIHLNNLTGITTAEMASANISQFTNDSGYLVATLTQEEVEDFVGGMVTGNTETLISVTYEDGDGTLDFVVDNDLANYSNASSGFLTSFTETNDLSAAVTWANVPDANITEGSVTQHEGAIDHGSISGLSDDDHTQYSLISSQFANPSSTPSRVGEINIDKTSDRVYIATDTASSADWDIMLSDGPAEIQSFGSKVSMANADIIMIEDSADSFNKKQVNFQNFIGNIDITDIASISTDFNSNYAWLPGRTGGQQLIGGDGSGDDLTLSSSNHPTKGLVAFGDSQEVYFDEQNGEFRLTNGMDLDLLGELQLNGSAGTSGQVILSQGSGSDPIYSLLPVASIANGTDGELITWDSSGVVTTVAVGTSGHVLTSNGAGAAPTFQASAGGDSVPIGVIFPYSGSTAPTGYLFCDGSEVSRTTYAAYFAVVSTTYGVGDGSTTFDLPDCRGRSVFGKDDMNNSVGTGGGAVSRLTSGSKAGVDGATLGASGGVEEHALTSAELASHTHNTTDRYDTAQNNMDSAGSGQIVRKVSVTNLARTTTETQTRDEAHTNVPPAFVLNYIIKVE